MKHISVLLEESLASLNLKESSTIVDCTLGYGGHSSEILKRIKKGHLFAFDQDIEAIKFASVRLNEISDNFTIIKSNFSHLKDQLQQREVSEVDGILFDLGVSSPQLDTKERGFSYHQDAKLDMRMDQEQKLSAYEVVNNYSEADLIRIFFDYGEEKFAKRIAANIIKTRQLKKIETTLELVEIIKRSVPAKVKKEKHPAKKVFQAIRIEVNSELSILRQTMLDALSMLSVGGVLSVITFHSLEDRLIKQLFNEVTKVDDMVKGLPNIPIEYLPNFELVNRKAILATKDELEENNRSRSAKLRSIKRVK